MKKILYAAIVAVATVCLSSCGIGAPVCQTEGVALSQGNFSYVRSVKAKATATYIFGIGGLSKTAKASYAIEKLKAENPLLANQAFTNFNVSVQRNCYVGIVMTSTTIVSADIVQFK